MPLPSRRISEAEEAESMSLKEHKKRFASQPLPSNVLTVHGGLDLVFITWAIAL